MMRELMRRIGLGGPDVSSEPDQYDKERIAREQKERNLVRARLRAMETEYGIPPRKEH